MAALATSRGRRTIVVIGDDFTPAELFADAIRNHPEVNTESVELRLADLTDATYRMGPHEKVREFLGCPEDVVALVGDASALVTTFAPITERVLDAASALELVVCGRGGPVNVDVRAATGRGIAVAFSPGRNAEAVAEFTLGQLIALSRRFVTAERYVRDGSWPDGREDTFAKPTGPELDGRVLGIVGFGVIGRRVAELVTPLHMRVLVYDPFVDAAAVRAAGATPVALEQLLAGSDMITVHVRPAEDKNAIIGRQELAQMRPGSYLVNTSRAANVDQAAVVDALKHGRLAGAALDVFEDEPLPPGHPLRSLDNVRLTPHSAGVSLDVPRRTAEMVATSVAAWLSNREPPYLANREGLKQRS